MSADDEKPEFQEPGIETTDDNSQSEEDTPDPKEKTQEKGEAPLSKEYQASEKSGGLRGVIITAAFTFLGVVIGVVGKGGADVFIEYLKADGTQNLERQKLDNDLVELAMHQKTQEDSGALLGFMVETKLIRDKDIRDGVQRYLTAHATKGPILSESPTIVQFLVAEQSLLSVVERHQGDFSNSWIVLPPRVDETIKKSSNPGNSLVFFNPEDAERAGIIIALLKSAFSLSQLDLKVSPIVEHEDVRIELFANGGLRLDKDKGKPVPLAAHSAAALLHFRLSRNVDIRIDKNANRQTCALLYMCIGGAPRPYSINGSPPREIRRKTGLDRRST